MNVVMGESAWTPQTHSIGSKSYLSPKMREVKSGNQKNTTIARQKMGSRDGSSEGAPFRKAQVNVLSNKTEKREQLDLFLRGLPIALIIALIPWSLFTIFFSSYSPLSLW